MTTQVNQTQDMFLTQNFMKARQVEKHKINTTWTRKLCSHTVARVPLFVWTTSICQCHFSTACTPIVSSRREFHTTLSSRLIGGNSYRKAGHVVVADTEKRLNRNLNHAPLRMPKPTTCKVHAQRVETLYLCAVCKIHMCTDPCFAQYHYLENFAYDDPNRVHKNKTRKHLKLTSK